MEWYTSEWQTERTILAPDFNAFYSLEYCVVYQIQIHTAKESESGKETTRKCQIPASITQPVHFFYFYFINKCFFFLLHAQLKYDQTMSFIGIWHGTFLSFYFPLPNFKTISFSIVLKYLVPFSPVSFNFKNHLGIHSFSSTCLVFFFTCLVGFLCFLIIDVVYFFFFKEKWKKWWIKRVVVKEEKGFCFQVNFFCELGVRREIALQSLYSKILTVCQLKTNVQSLKAKLAYMGTHQCHSCHL